MINLLLGAPGGGKSYEAVAFHILPSVKAGRKVVTNLPLDLDAWAQLDPDYPALLEIREKTLALPPDESPVGRVFFGRQVAAPEWKPRAFAHVEDFADPWRHPVSGIGPLYVVDECHMCWPARATDVEVEEWASMHRHHNVDVLAITQSYGKVSKSIIDLVQVVYRVRKAVAFGSMDKYIRKVQDGIKGDVVNTSIREYKKKYQELYRSHTKGRAVEEMSGSDIVPIWRRWPFIGAAVCLLIVAGMALSGKMQSPLAQGVSIAQSKPGQKPVSKSASAANGPAAAPSKPMPGKPAEPEPFAGRGLHLAGEVVIGSSRGALFSLSQNGQHLRYIRSAELASAGYIVTITGPCSARIVWKDQPRTLICDWPRVAPGIGGGVSLGAT